MEMQNGLVPHSYVVVKIKKDISATEVPSRNKGSQPHIRTPGLGFQCWEDKFP